ncbi:MAG: calcium-translocating P-type ATPase, SERCA-type [Acuticoccus sp.]
MGFPAALGCYLALAPKERRDATVSATLPFYATLLCLIFDANYRLDMPVALIVGAVGGLLAGAAKRARRPRQGAPGTEVASSAPLPERVSPGSAGTLPLMTGEPMDTRPPTPFRLSAEAVTRALASDLAVGLAATEAARRLARGGPNALAEAVRVSPVTLFVHQFRSPLLLILLAGAAISGFTGHHVDAVAISVIVILNALISFWQEFRAEQSIAALKKMSAPVATVRRDAAWREVPARDLVTGDVIRIRAGDIIPADLRITEANRLQIDEAPLTGESEPIEKHAEAIDDPDTILAERVNMAFMSTLVTNGTGTGIVTATGMATEVGQIAGLMAAAREPRTPLQERIESLSRVLMIAALIVVAIVIAIGLRNGMDAMEMLNTAISLSVAAIPEGLPTVVTIVLTLGSQTMAAHNALVRRLSSVETLGTTSVICTDKTGTLTQNQMQVMRLWAGGCTYSVTGEGFDPHGAFIDAAGAEVDVETTLDLKHALMISAYCNEARLGETDGRPSVQGNPTEGALVVAAAKAGIRRDALKSAHYDLLRAAPFDSTRKMMSMLVCTPAREHILVAKGAPDVILSRATHVRVGGAAVDLTAARRAEIEAVIEGFGSEALRTLAVAYRPLRVEDEQEADPEHDVVLIGILGIMDPPRRQVRDAVADAASAGVRTVMITGDHAVTARAIARRIGIIRTAAQTVHTGAEIDGMSDEALRATVRHAAVFARVTPEHKLRIVTALQANGEVAAMTGDGVNDAPALRRADIGIAMGIAGTSVAKDSSALILLDDDFSTIVGAVREGRRIYDNLKKFVRQALTANVAEVSTILFAFLLMGADPLLPLTPLMILWVNLISDGVPALALGVEPAEPDVMRRKPRERNETIFAGGLKERILIRGLAVGALSYWGFETALARGASVEYAQTLAFATLIFAQLWHLFDARSVTTIFGKNPFGNRVLLAAAGFSAVLSLCAIYTAPGHAMLGTVPLAPHHLAQAVFMAALPTLVLSGIKELFGVRFL